MFAQWSGVYGWKITNRPKFTEETRKVSKNGVIRLRTAGTDVTEMSTARERRRRR